MDKLTIEHISRATCAEDVFGTLNGSKAEQLAAAKKIYKRLAKVVHEDLFPNDQKEYARAAFVNLGELWQAAQQLIKDGTYGNRKPPKSKAVTIVSKKYTYANVERIAEGGTCGIFKATVIPQNVKAIIRIPHSAKDNDLMGREATTSRFFKKHITNNKLYASFQERIPYFVESLKLKGDGKVANIFLQEIGDNWHTLEQIRRVHTKGVNTRIAIFIFNRILETLAFAHALNIAHGTITPNHVLINTDTHKGIIIDWTCSGTVGSKLPYKDPKYLEYFPSAEIITPSGDLYMAAWCVVYVLGGSVKNKTIPNTVEQPIKEFLNKCLQLKPRHRPSHKTVYEEFNKVVEQVFGPKKFVPLQMTGT